VLDILKIRQAGAGALVCAQATGEAAQKLVSAVRKARFNAAKFTLKCDQIRSKAMAQVCDICGKGPQFGNNISHAHNVTRRRWNPNLQAVKAMVNGAAKRIRVCTSCIKSGKVAKA
jgi:large subunit ribosomal protein L28